MSQVQQEQEFWSIPSEVLHNLGSSIQQGLTSKEANMRKGIG
jgi:hypothetical protein